MSRERRPCRDSWTLDALLETRSIAAAHAFPALVVAGALILQQVEEHQWLGSLRAASQMIRAWLPQSPRSFASTAELVALGDQPLLLLGQNLLRRFLAAAS